jgi:hypothetical protein
MSTVQLQAVGYTVRSTAQQLATVRTSASPILDALSAADRCRVYMLSHSRSQPAFSVVATVSSGVLVYLCGLITSPIAPH